MNYGPQWWRQERPESEWKYYEDFRWFVVLVWSHLKLPRPTPVQLDICLWLSNRQHRRKMVKAFRGVGKSWLTAAYVLWSLLQDPQLRILVVSASKERADQFSTFCKQLIEEMPILAHLAPRPGQRDSKIAFDVGPSRPDQSPSVKSVGIFGQLTGSRADKIIFDDVEVPNNAETQGMRDKLSERVKEAAAILKPLDTSEIIYLGTPQTEDSIYNKLPERGYVIRTWPARVPDDKTLELMSGELAPSILKAIEDGRAHFWDPVDTRFSHDKLLEAEIEYARSGFALQFQLDTRLSDRDRYPLRLSDLLVLGFGDSAPEALIHAKMADYVVQELPNVGLTGDRYYQPAQLDGDWIPFAGTIVSVDPSGRGKDETTWAVIKMLNGYLYLAEVGASRSGYDDATMAAIVSAAKRHKAANIVIEENFGDGMFAALLKPHLRREYPCAVDEVRSNRQKELRIIDTLEPVMNQHRLVVHPDVIQWDYDSVGEYPTDVAYRYRLFYQMSRVTKEKGSLTHDDRLDAVAIGVAWWVESMGQDEAQRMKDRRDKLFKAELQVLSSERRDGLHMDLLIAGASPEDAARAARRKTGRAPVGVITTFHPKAPRKARRSTLGKPRSREWVPPSKR